MYKKFKESNGLTVIVSPMPHMASVALGVWIGVGGRYESASESGISHFIEHMVFKGTRGRSAKDLKESIEGIGGGFNGFTSDEVTCYMVKVPEKYTALGLDVLSDMVIDPKFDDPDIAKEKYVVCEEIKMYRDQPADHVLDALGELMWPDNPLGRRLTGTISTVKKLKRDELVKFKEENYHPGNIAVVAAGKLDPESFAKAAAASFSGLKPRKTRKVEAVSWGQSAPKTKFLSDKTQQAHIAFGFPMPDSSIKERYAARVMDVAFGGNMSSRLFEELREKNGLCYDISSSLKRHSDVGEMLIHAGVDARKACTSAAAIVDQILIMRDIGLTEGELLRAKEYTKGQFLLMMERTSARMLWLGDRHMVEKSIPETLEIVKLIESVTLDDVKKACERVFVRERANLAVIGKLGDKEKHIIRKTLDRL
jgi:predicted Zn-dependent peptidase